jgi:hypothetical protein
MSVWIHAVYALMHLGLFIWLIRLIRASEDARLRCAVAITALIVAGLVYDNVMLTVGAWIGPGEFLRMLSVPRFWLHALATPLIGFAVLELLAAAKVSWASKRGVRMAVVAVVVVLIGMGVYVDATLELHVACFDGVMRYTPNVLPNQLCGPDSVPVSSGGGPPIPSIAVTVWMLIAGVILWRRERIPWLFAGAALMFVAAGAPIPTMGLVPGNGGEVLLNAGTALTLARLVNR